MNSNYEYERELVERIENDSFHQGNPIVILMAVAEDKNILDLVVKVGDDKHRSIAATVADIKASNNRYRKVTLNQKRAIAKFLVEKFGTARAAMAAAAGVTEQEMFGGEESQAEVTETESRQPVATSTPRASRKPVDPHRAEFLGFKPLKGSEKQIEWANRIRDRIITNASLDKIQELVDHQKSGNAKWWIDHRDYPLSELIKTA